MNTAAHQRHAARCRHAKSSEAKRSYCHELSEKLKTSPHVSNLNAFASAARVMARRDSTRFGVRESTLRTWLREWKTTILADA